MDNSKSIKLNFNKLLRKATALVVIGAFLVSTVFIDFAWAKTDSFLRVPVDARIRKEIENKLIANSLPPGSPATFFRILTSPAYKGTEVSLETLIKETKKLFKEGTKKAEVGLSVDTIERDIQILTNAGLVIRGKIGTKITFKVNSEVADSAERMKVAQNILDDEYQWGKIGKKTKTKSERDRIAEKLKKAVGSYRLSGEKNQKVRYHLFESSQKNQILKDLIDEATKKGEDIDFLLEEIRDDAVNRNFEFLSLGLKMIKITKRMGYFSWYAYYDDIDDRFRGGRMERDIDLAEFKSFYKEILSINEELGYDTKDTVNLMHILSKTFAPSSADLRAFIEEIGRDNLIASLRQRHGLNIISYVLDELASFFKDKKWEKVILNQRIYEGKMDIDKFKNLYTEIYRIFGIEKEEINKSIAINSLQVLSLLCRNIFEKGLSKEDIDSISGKFGEGVFHEIFASDNFFKKMWVISDILEFGLDKFSELNINMESARHLLRAEPSLFDAILSEIPKELEKIGVDSKPILKDLINCGNSQKMLKFMSQRVNERLRQKGKVSPGLEADIRIILLFRKKRVANSLNFLEGKAKSILARKPGRDEKYKRIDKVDKLLLNALIETGVYREIEKIIYDEKIMLDTKIEYFDKLCTEGVFDIDLKLILIDYQAEAQGSERFFEVLKGLNEAFPQVKPVGELVKTILDKKLPIDDLKKRKGKVEDLMNQPYYALWTELLKDKDLSILYYCLIQPERAYSNGNLSYDKFMEVLAKANALRVDIQEKDVEELQELFLTNFPEKDAAAKKKTREMAAKILAGKISLPIESKFLDEEGNFIPRIIDLESQRKQRYLDIDNKSSFHSNELKNFILINYLAGELKKMQYEHEGLNDILENMQNIMQAEDILETLKVLYKEALVKLKKKEPERIEVYIQEQLGKHLKVIIDKMKAKGDLNLLLKGKKGEEEKPEFFIDGVAFYKNYGRFGNIYEKAQANANFDRIAIKLRPKEELPGREELLKRLLLGIKEIVSFEPEIPDEVYEELIGHFISSARDMESYVLKPEGDTSWLKAQQITIGYLGRKYLPAFMRFSDGAPCCMATNQSNFKRDMPKYLADVIHQFFCIATETKNIGWLKISLVKNSETNKLEMASNQLYLEVKYRYPVLHNAIWQEMYPVFQEMGISKNQINISTYKGASACGPPDGFKETPKTLTRIQKMKDTSFVSGDLSLPGNRAQRSQFYVAEKEPGAAATLLAYMHKEGIFRNNSQKRKEMAGKRGGNDSPVTIHKELKVLQAVGLVEAVKAVNDIRKVTYYLPEWLRNMEPEDIIKENPELKFANPNDGQIEAVAARVKAARLEVLKELGDSVSLRLDVDKPDPSPLTERDYCIMTKINENKTLEEIGSELKMSVSSLNRHSWMIIAHLEGKDWRGIKVHGNIRQLQEDMGKGIKNLDKVSSGFCALLNKPKEEVNGVIKEFWRMKRNPGQRKIKALIEVQKIKVQKIKAASEEFRNSISRLRQTEKLSRQYSRNLSLLQKTAAVHKFSTPKSLVLYAEPLLENFGIGDLEEALGILLKNNVLGEVILYAEDPVYNDILEKLIKETAPELKIITKTNEELGLKDSATEIEEIETLIGEEKNILCVIKGTVEAQNRVRLRRFSKDKNIPIIVFKEADGKHIYSLADALQSAITAEKGIIALPPVETGDIEEEYKEYKESLRELSGA